MSVYEVNAQGVMLATWVFVAGLVVGAIVYTTLAHSMQLPLAQRLRETAWALVPVLIAVAAAVPALRGAEPLTRMHIVDANANAPQYSAAELIAASPRSLAATSL